MAKEYAGGRLAIWFGLSLLYIWAWQRAMSIQFVLFPPPVELTRSEWLGYNVPPALLLVLSLAILWWPRARPSKVTIVVGILWFIFGGLGFMLLMAV